MKRVLFIAGIGKKNQSHHGGMVAKNRYFLEYLKTKNIKLKVINTYDPKTSFLKKAIKKITNRLLMIKCLFYSAISDEVIISDHAYGIISMLNRFNFSSKVTFFVVGCSLIEKLKNNKLKVKDYRALKCIYVQANKMKNELNDLGLGNVAKVSNFKTFQSGNTRPHNYTNKPLKLFYIGRITPKKGIGLAIDAINELNRDGVNFTLDFFGPLDNEIKSTFLNQIDKTTYLNYCGILDLVNDKKVYQSLLKYDIFVFPSYWPGEAFPGVFIDSFIVGKPIIASDWHYNSEIVKDGYNGLLFASKDKNDLIIKLKAINNNRGLLEKLSNNALKSSKNYHTNYVLKVLDDVLS